MIDLCTPEGSGIFRTQNGVDLFCRWLNASPSRARVYVVHGVGEHSGRYGFLQTALHSRGYSVFIADNRGMGRSSGLPGDIESFDDYMLDLTDFITLIEKQQGMAPAFVLGHSMGTIVAARFAAERQISLNGVILMSMPIKLLNRPNPLVDQIGRWASTYFPRIRIPLGIPSTQLSSEPAVIRATDEDPLMNRQVTLRWGKQMLDAADRLSNVVRTIDLPVLILHGSEDVIADCSAIRHLDGRMLNPESRIFIFPGMRHELHNEIENLRMQVLERLLLWLDTLLSRSPGQV